MSNGNLLTVAQAAERLFGSDDTANYKRTLHLINSGEIHHLIMGRNILIIKDDGTKNITKFPVGPEKNIIKN